MLISVIGMDSAGDILLRHWQSLQLPYNGILRKASVTTSMTSYIFNQGVFKAVKAAPAKVQACVLTHNSVHLIAADCLCSWGCSCIYR